MLTPLKKVVDPAHRPAPNENFMKSEQERTIPGGFEPESLVPPDGKRPNCRVCGLGRGRIMVSILLNELVGGLLQQSNYRSLQRDMCSES